MDASAPAKMYSGKSIGCGGFRDTKAMWEISICDAVVFQDSALAFSENCSSAYLLDKSKLIPYFFSINLKKCLDFCGEKLHNNVNPGTMW